MLAIRMGFGKGRLMSALGQKQTFAAQKIMSALAPIADMCSATWNVRLVPIADIRQMTRGSRKTASRRSLRNLIRCFLIRRLPALSASCASRASPSSRDRWRIEVRREAGQLGSKLRSAVHPRSRLEPRRQSESDPPAHPNGTGPFPPLSRPGSCRHS